MAGLGRGRRARELRVPGMEQYGAQPGKIGLLPGAADHGRLPAHGGGLRGAAQGRAADARAWCSTRWTRRRPYLTVPSHVMVNPAGEFQGVNYDHCVLGLRAVRRLLPYLSPSTRCSPWPRPSGTCPRGSTSGTSCCASSPATTPGTTRSAGCAPGARTRRATTVSTARPGTPPRSGSRPTTSRTGRARSSSACSACRRGSWRGTSTGPTSWPWACTREPEEAARRALEVAAPVLRHHRPPGHPPAAQAAEHRAQGAYAPGPWSPWPSLVGWEQRPAPALLRRPGHRLLPPPLPPVRPLHPGARGALQERPVHPQGAQPQRHVPGGAEALIEIDAQRDGGGHHPAPHRTDRRPGSA